jgi:hypothetical protein
VNRDELARHLYIHENDEDGAPQSWRDAGAQEWDAGQATPDDVQNCYERADRLIENGEATR